MTNNTDNADAGTANNVAGPGGKQAMSDKRVANIHEALTGRWYITDDSAPYLDESGYGYASERAAIKAARESGKYTHRVSRIGRIAKL